MAKVVCFDKDAPALRAGSRTGSEQYCSEIEESHFEVVSHFDGSTSEPMLKAAKIQVRFPSESYHKEFFDKYQLFAWLRENLFMEMGECERLFSEMRRQHTLELACLASQVDMGESDFVRDASTSGEFASVTPVRLGRSGLLEGR